MFVFVPILWCVHKCRLTCPLSARIFLWEKVNKRDANYIYLVKRMGRWMFNLLEFVGGDMEPTEDPASANSSSMSEGFTDDDGRSSSGSLKLTWNIDLSRVKAIINDVT